MTENQKVDQQHTDTPQSELQNIIEAALYAADEPMSVRKLQALFIDGAQPSIDDITHALDALIEQYQTRGLELIKVGGGWRFQTREKYATWMRRIQSSKAPRFSRAQLETLAIIAYRQPVTRGDIEGVRGVAVSSDIIRLLEERGWIREIGHRDVPGRPALFGTTHEFLAYFNLQSLRQLPELIEKRRFEDIAQEMHMNLSEEESKSTDTEVTLEAETPTLEDKASLEDTPPLEDNAKIIPLHDDTKHLHVEQLDVSEQDGESSPIEEE